MGSAIVQPVAMFTCSTGSQDNLMGGDFKVQWQMAGVDIISF